MPVNIQESEIEIVTSYKYLGVYFNNKLDWSDNTVQVYKKGQTSFIKATEILWRVSGTVEDLL